MSDYGSHPTIYGSLSDSELYSLYRWDSWTGLDEGHRQQLLQETVNRSAAENGEKGSCKVVFADLGPGVAGEQSGDTIRMSRQYLDDQFWTAKNGKLVQEAKLGSNLEALTTVLHEDQHAFQNQVIDGTIPAPDPTLQREYAANNFNPVTVTEADGTVKPGLAYIYGDNNSFGYYLYYMQSTERDAHRISEEKAMKIVEALEKEYGNEPSFDAFRKELEANGFEAAMLQAQALFGSKTVEHDVNASLMNHVYGTNEKVDPQVDKMVEKELAATYEATVRHELERSGEPKSAGGKENTMEVDWKNLHVTEEEYDAALRSSVNAYYEHAKADPSMSEEEVVKTTSEMAERYLTSVEEFHEQVTQNETVETAETTAAAETTAEAGTGTAAVDNGGGMDGGVDDGGVDDDGGIE